jgi:hypothetical protein
MDMGTNFVQSLSGNDARGYNRNNKTYPGQRSNTQDFGRGINLKQNNPAKRLQHGPRAVQQEPVFNTFKKQEPAFKKQEVEDIHPSWAASKMRKLQQSNIQAFQGKKTTFDD